MAFSRPDGCLFVPLEEAMKEVGVHILFTVSQGSYGIGKGAGRCAAFRTGIAQLEGLLHVQIVHLLDFQNRPGEDVDLALLARSAGPF